MTETPEGASSGPYNASGGTLAKMCEHGVKRLHCATCSQPVLPYSEPGGQEATAGWSGSETSHERALDERDSGEVTRRQQVALALLADAGTRGLTWHDLTYATGLHHGQTSGVLTVLHKAGRIARLTERRARCLVYVLPEHVEGRPLSAYTPRPRGIPTPDVEAVEKVIHRLLIDTGFPIAAHRLSARLAHAVVEEITHPTKGTIR